MRSFPIQTGLTIAMLGAALGGARLVTPAKKPSTAPVAALATTIQSKPEALFDDSSEALDRFYQSLARADSVTRIVHYGDSPTTADLVTGDVRTLLQTRYGDAGHGFILPGRPWAWYQHTGAQVTGKGWEMHPASRFEKRDGLFGLGGVSFAGTGASSRIEFDIPQSRFELWYLREPGGGTVALTADGIELGRVDTSSDPGNGFAAFEAREPAYTLELKVVQGRARIFGVAAERSGPGVVYDALGLNGASVGVISRMFNPEHLAEQLRHRSPDLLILNYGTNEADFASFVEGPQYETDLREALRRLRAALPDTPILLMSPMDRGHRNATGEIETMPTIPEIVATQRRVAGETGCGFFDTFLAMGGAGTMARWYAAQPRLVSADFIHPHPAGGKQIAEVFARELNAGLDRYKQRHASTSAVR
jgi:lysophospholipase L1-like esterase